MGTRDAWRQVSDLAHYRKHGMCRFVFHSLLSLPTNFFRVVEHIAFPTFLFDPNKHIDGVALSCFSSSGFSMIPHNVSDPVSPDHRPLNPSGGHRFFFCSLFWGTDLPLQSWIITTTSLPNFYLARGHFGRVLSTRQSTPKRGPRTHHPLIVPSSGTILQKVSGTSQGSTPTSCVPPFPL